ncbi:MAG: MFS transporter [Dehalococcoidales bacterium]|nr:MFS transporter [Dehalococcoidales bacterium]
MAENSPAMVGQGELAQVATPRLLLVLLCGVAFATSLNNAMLNPVLPDIADSLGVPIAAAGQLATASMITGAMAALVMGTLSDVYGRRTFVVGGLVALGVASLALAFAPTFAWALLGRTLAGFGYVMAVTLAIVGDWYGGAQRDRAAARILAADAVAWIAGVPIVAVAAQLLGWRAGVAGYAVVVLSVAVACLAWLPNRRSQMSRVALRSVLRTIWREHRGRSELLLVLAANGARSTCTMGFLAYASAFYREVFGLATWQVGPLIAVTAVAFVLGTIAGGRWSGTVGPRRLSALGCLLTGTFICVNPLMPTLVLATLATLLFAMFGGITNSTLIALLLRLATANRGATMALNSTLVSLGNALGVSVGGIGLAALGYPGLGLAVAAFAALAAGLVYTSGSDAPS